MILWSQVGAPVVPEKYGFQSALDHTPHELFVEMDELEGEQWVERARCVLIVLAVWSVNI